jgi:hypothetical protein
MELETSDKADRTLTGIFMNSDTVSVYYTYKDLLAVNLVQNISSCRPD